MRDSKYSCSTFSTFFLTISRCKFWHIPHLYFWEALYDDLFMPNHVPDLLSVYLISHKTLRQLFLFSATYVPSPFVDLISTFLRCVGAIKFKMNDIFHETVTWLSLNIWYIFCVLLQTKYKLMRLANHLHFKQCLKYFKYLSHLVICIHLHQKLIF